MSPIWKLEAALEMSVMQERPLRAAGAQDQADGDPGDHVVSVGASGRGTVTSPALSDSPLLTRERVRMCHPLRQRCATSMPPPGAGRCHAATAPSSNAVARENAKMMVLRRDFASA